MSIKCKGCGKELPEDAKFCLSCGRSVDGDVPAGPTENDLDPNGFGMLMVGLSFMMFFFSLVPMFLGVWWGMIAMMAAGAAMLVVRHFTIRGNRREWEKRQQRKELKEAKVRCRYCSTLNEQEAVKCESCGASLW